MAKEKVNEIQRVKVGLNNILVLTEVALDRKTVNGAHSSLSDIARLAKSQLKYLETLVGEQMRHA